MINTRRKIETNNDLEQAAILVENKKRHILNSLPSEKKKFWRQNSERQQNGINSQDRKKNKLNNMRKSFQ